MDINMSKKFLKHIEDSFLIWILKELTRKGALLGLLVVSGGGLMSGVMIDLPQ